MRFLNNSLNLELKSNKVNSHMNYTDSEKWNDFDRVLVVNELFSDGCHFIGIITSFGAIITYYANDSVSNMFEI